MLVQKYGNLLVFQYWIFANNSLRIYTKVFQWTWTLHILLFKRNFLRVFYYSIFVGSIYLCFVYFENKSWYITSIDELRIHLALFKISFSDHFVNSQRKTSRLCMTMQTIQVVCNKSLWRKPRLQNSGSLKSASPLPNLAFDVWGEYSQSYFLKSQRNK